MENIRESEGSAEYVLDSLRSFRQQAKYKRGGTPDVCMLVLPGADKAIRTFATWLRGYLASNFDPVDFYELPSEDDVVLYASNLHDKKLVLVGNQDNRKKYEQKISELRQQGVVTNNVIWAFKSSDTMFSGPDHPWISSFGQFAGEEILKLYPEDQILLLPIKSGGVPFGEVTESYLQERIPGRVARFEIGDPKKYNIKRRLPRKLIDGKVPIAVDDGIYTSTTYKEFALQMEALKSEWGLRDWLFAVKYDQVGFADIAQDRPKGINKIPREQILSQLDRDMLGSKDSFAGTILVVDDDLDYRTILENLLSDEGYPVKASGDPSDIHRRLRTGKERPSVLVTDLVMPQLGGLQLAISSRSMEPPVPTILMSAYIPDEKDEVDLYKIANKLGVRLVDKGNGVEEVIQYIKELYVE